MTRRISASEQFLDLMRKKQIIASEERSALRVPRKDSEHERLIGVNTSGFGIFWSKFKAEIEFLRKVNIVRADQIARTFNKKGFKTSSGHIWTADLISYARDMVRRERGR